MRVIIAGSREGAVYKNVVDAVRESCWDITEVVSGGARGVDKLGEEFAKKNSIPLKTFHANWTKYGKRAGPIRNKKMAEYADALIAIWDGKSRGTKDMICQATIQGLWVHVFNV